MTDAIADQVGPKLKQRSLVRIAAEHDILLIDASPRAEAAIWTPRRTRSASGLKLRAAGDGPFRWVAADQLDVVGSDLAA